jgi:hypothetical protein
MGVRGEGLGNVHVIENAGSKVSILEAADRRRDEPVLTKAERRRAMRETGRIAKAFVAGTEVSSCFDCGAAYGAAQWSALELVKRLDARELVALVRPWPADLVVEARACASCGRTLSRVSRTSVVAV